MAISCKKHTIIPNRELGCHADFQQSMNTYTLSPEELRRYQSIPQAEKFTRPFIIPVRK